MWYRSPMEKCADRSSVSRYAASLRGRAAGITALGMRPGSGRFRKGLGVAGGGIQELPDLAFRRVVKRDAKCPRPEQVHQAPVLPDDRSGHARLVVLVRMREPEQQVVAGRKP